MRLIEWLTRSGVRASRCCCWPRCSPASARAPGTAASTHGLAHDRRTSPGTAGGIREAHGRAHARARAGAEPRRAEVDDRAVEAARRRRRAAAAHHGAGRPRHVDRVRRNLLRDAVLGRRGVAAAAAPGEPGDQPRSSASTRDLGRVVPAACSRSCSGTSRSSAKGCSSSWRT